MLMFRKKHPRSGFTLIELAIVLSVVGLMSIGLWRLLSSSNQQLKDTAAASEQAQLISAVSSFLASSDGQNFMTTNAVQCAATGGNCGANVALILPLPSSGNAAGTAGCNSDTNFATGPKMTFGPNPSQANTWCNTLPVGFSAGTTNSYGQTYMIQVLRDSTASGYPVSYSFMIVTSGGDTISDTSGGRISSQIGGDGGFLYSTNVCGAPVNQMACGSYGSWNQNVTGYGFPGGSTGHVASRTYILSNGTNSGPWLARLNMGIGFSTLQPGGATGANIYLNGQTICSGSTACVPSVGTAPTNDKSEIWIVSDGTYPAISLKNGSGLAANLNPLLQLNSNCGASPMLSPGANAAGAGPLDTCPYALSITGDASISNILNANVFYSNSDLRLKKNVRPVTNGLDDIMRLKPVYFTYRSNGAESLGVIAQDVEKVYPQLVSQGDEKAMKSVNYEGLIAPLISAVQELKHENDDLRAQLHSQEMHQIRLEQQLKADEKAN